MDERAYLGELAKKPFLVRVPGYLKLAGPGYIQSALTLGGASTASCVVMGSLAGYKLLWVQPLGIVLGVCVLAAVAKQTCHTGERAYQVFWERLHPSLAILWGVSALLASLIWHVPQYSLTANGAITLAGSVGLDLDTVPTRLLIGAVILGCGCGAAYLYHVGARGLRAYEIGIQCLVWSIVLAFAVVGFASGIRWKAFFLGITGVSFAKDVAAHAVDGRVVKPIVSGLAAAVGINMLFLYPYSLLKRNWGKEHKELAYFDLFAGMLVPFLIATTFLVIGTANTLGPVPGEYGNEVQRVADLIPALKPTFGDRLSTLLVGFGMMAVGFSTITTMMLASGFICCEMFGFEHRGKAGLWFSFLPGIAVFGVCFSNPWFVAITTSTLCAPLMPMAVICFVALLNMKSYMGDETPRGGRRLIWNGVLGLAVAAMIVWSCFSLWSNWQDIKRRLEPRQESVATAYAWPVEEAAMETI